MTTPIPSPPSYPIIGNILDIDPTSRHKSFKHLAQIYGPIFKLHLPASDLIVVSNHELFDEINDEKRFTKRPSGPVIQLVPAIHNGLFSADFGDPLWERAHRILVPVFGPLAIRDMFDEMHEIATQLVLKWARYGQDYKIDASSDFTRLTLDSIALCSMDTRFNSFYHEEMHPFVQAMTAVLLESGRRANRPALMNRLMTGSEKKYLADIDVMQSIAQKIVAERKKDPTAKKDLVAAMLTRKDPKTGEMMTDDNIADNMITFLIAGHETTSGLLSFTIHNLIKHPETMQKARREVDEVIGTGPIKVEHMSKLPYITAVLRETLRLTPTIPGTTIGPRPDITENPIIIGGGKYKIDPSDRFTYILSKVHSDPAVYGDDAHLFKPERMLDEHFDKLPKNAWKPFGNGARACIGRAFAWQESMLAVAMLLQVFDFRFDDPGYKLEIRETLTHKPADLYIHASLRKGIDVTHLEKFLSKDSATDTTTKSLGGSTTATDAKDADKSMAIFFGGNMGTCESLAGSLAKSAASYGFKADVKPLDEAAGNLPRNSPVLIITSSYEGQPPDNAQGFVTWLKGLKGSDELKGVRYSVFGCGNRDWKETYQRIPTVVDTTLAERGAHRILDRGLADAANNDIFNDFEKWEEEHLWPAIKSAFGSGDSHEDVTALDLDVSTTLRSSHLRQDVKSARIIKNELLTPPNAPPKRHIELQLPTEMTYRAGDYLAVLPLNQDENVHRALTRFRLPWDSFMTVKGGQTHIPRDTGLSVRDVLSAYVELSQTATRKNVELLAKYAQEDPSTLSALKSLSTDLYAKEIQAKHTSVLDLLERFPDLPLPFPEFLSTLPQLRLRQYSISSSPLADPNVCGLTFTVLDAPALSQPNGVNGDSPAKRYLGVASTYLASLKAGDQILVNVKPSHQAFHLPLEPAKTPIVMVCAGTGIAPFRGFVQERAKQIDAGRSLAPALLFVGCRNPNEDALHKAELEEWSGKGAVDVRWAFSRPDSSGEKKQYVQDRYWADRDEVSKLYHEGAQMYMCGSGKVADGVRETTMKMMKVKKGEDEHREISDQEADEWFSSLRNERFMSDVFD